MGEFIARGWNLRNLIHLFHYDINLKTKNPPLPHFAFQVKKKG